MHFSLEINLQFTINAIQTDSSIRIIKMEKEVQCQRRQNYMRTPHPAQQWHKQQRVEEMLPDVKRDFL